MVPLDSALCAGRLPFATEMWAGLDEAARLAMFERISASYPAGRPGHPDEIARQLLLLSATPYATGVVVVLDGGASIA